MTMTLQQMAIAVVLTMVIMACDAQPSQKLAWAQAAEAANSPGLPQTLGEIPEGFENRRELSHFVLLWHTGETTSEEIHAAETGGERLWLHLAAELGQEKVPTAKLIVTFQGDCCEGGRVISPTGTPQIPYVDQAGRIHLFRLPWQGQGGGYLASLGHEMVHAFRAEWSRTRGWHGFVRDKRHVWLSLCVLQRYGQAAYRGAGILQA